MEKMGKIAKNMDNVLQAVYTAFSIAVWVLLACMVILPFAGEHMLEMTGTIGIELGCVNLEVVDSYIPEGGIILRIELGLLYVALLLGAGCYVVKLLREVVKPMIELRPFDGSVSGILRKLSFVALIGGGILSFTKMMGEIALAYMYDFPTLFLNEQIVGVNLEFVMDMNFILAFAVLYLLSFVFRYGEELQQQSDETL